MSKQNIFNNKIERSDQKAYTNTSAEMKISHNLKQDSFSEKNNSKTVEIGNKRNERKQCQKQNIFNNKIERSDQKANTNTSAQMKISHSLKQVVSSENEIVHRQLISKTKQMKEKQCQKQNIFRQ